MNMSTSRWENWSEAHQTGKRSAWLTVAEVGGDRYHKG